MATDRQLIVLRHAKSSWDDPGLDDHDRPLAPRGRRAVQMLNEHLRTAKLEPQQVLCSSARRTRETLDGVDPTGERIIERSLYSASTTDLIARLREVPDEVRSVMLVGHNPAMQMLVLRLTGANGNGGAGGRAGDNGDPADLAEVQRKFPTGGLATLDISCDWSDVGPGCARLSAFVRPRHLSGSPRRGLR